MTLLAHRSLLLSAASGEVVEHVGIVWSQSSIYPGLSAADAINMRDNNTTSVTGTGTNVDGGNAFIAAFLGSAKQVSIVELGGGALPGWGSTYNYLRASKVQSSPDNVNWTDRVVITESTSPTDTGTTRNRQYTISPVVAAYWRIVSTVASYVSTCSFRLYG